MNTNITHALLVLEIDSSDWTGDALTMTDRFDGPADVQESLDA